jgi:hypothetical protein
MVTTAGRKQVDQAPTGTTRGALVGRKPAGVGAASGVGAVPRGWATGHWPHGSGGEATELARADQAATASAAAATRTKLVCRITVFRAMRYVEIPCKESTGSPSPPEHPTPSLPLSRGGGRTSYAALAEMFGTTLLTVDSGRARAPRIRCPIELAGSI